MECLVAHVCYGHWCNILHNDFCSSSTLQQRIYYLFHANSCLVFHSYLPLHNELVQLQFLYKRWMFGCLITCYLINPTAGAFFSRRRRNCNVVKSTLQCRVVCRPTLGTTRERDKMKERDRKRHRGTNTDNEPSVELLYGWSTGPDQGTNHLPLD